MVALAGMRLSDSQNSVTDFFPTPHCHLDPFAEFQGMFSVATYYYTCGDSQVLLTLNTDAITVGLHPCVIMLLSLHRVMKEDDSRVFPFGRRKFLLESKK